MLQAKDATPAPAQEKGGEIMAMGQAKLIEILKNPGATDFARAKACQRLAVIGTKDAVPALKALLADAKFAHYARFGLEPIPDPSADEALRSALENTSGKLRAGIIRSIGIRRDAGAVPVLAKLLDDDDAEVAAAAAAALGRISGAEAATELQRVLQRTRTVAGACLECAEGLLSKGNKEQARALYEAVLLRPDLPGFMKEAAARGKETAGRA